MSVSETISTEMLRLMNQLTTSVSAEEQLTPGTTLTASVVERPATHAGAGAQRGILVSGSFVPVDIPAEIETGARIEVLVTQSTPELKLEYSRRAPAPELGAAAAQSIREILSALGLNEHRIAAGLEALSKLAGGATPTPIPADSAELLVEILKVVRPAQIISEEELRDPRLLGEKLARPSFERELLNSVRAVLQLNREESGSAISAPLRDTVRETVRLIHELLDRSEPLDRTTFSAVQRIVKAIGDTTRAAPEAYHEPLRTLAGEIERALKSPTPRSEFLRVVPLAHSLLTRIQEDPAAPATAARAAAHAQKLVAEVGASLAKSLGSTPQQQSGTAAEATPAPPAALQRDAVLKFLRLLDEIGGTAGSPRGFAALELREQLGRQIDALARNEQRIRALLAAESGELSALRMTLEVIETEPAAGDTELQSRFKSFVRELAAQAARHEINPPDRSTLRNLYSSALERVYREFSLPPAQERVRLKRTEIDGLSAEQVVNLKTIEAQLRAVLIAVERGHGSHSAAPADALRTLHKQIQRLEQSAGAGTGTPYTELLGTLKREIEPLTVDGVAPGDLARGVRQSLQYLAKLDLNLLSRSTNGSTGALPPNEAVTQISERLTAMLASLDAALGLDSGEDLWTHAVREFGRVLTAYRAGAPQPELPREPGRIERLRITAGLLRTVAEEGAELLHSRRDAGEVPQLIKLAGALASELQQTVSRGELPLSEARSRVLAALRSFEGQPPAEEPPETGHTQQLERLIGESVQHLARPLNQRATPSEALAVLRRLAVSALTALQEALRDESAVPDSIAGIPQPAVHEIQQRIEVTQAAPELVTLLRAARAAGKSPEDTAVVRRMLEALSSLLPEHASAAELDLVEAAAELLRRIPSETSDAHTSREALRHAAAVLQNRGAIRSSPVEAPLPGNIDQQTLISLERMLTTQETLNQMQPLMKALGDPLMALFPAIVQGFLSQIEVTYHPPAVSAEERRQSPGKDGVPFQLVHVRCTLPGLGPVEVRLAHRPGEIMLRIGVADSARAEFLRAKVGLLEKRFAESGYLQLQFEITEESKLSASTDKALQLGALRVA